MSPENEDKWLRWTLLTIDVIANNDNTGSTYLTEELQGFECPYIETIKRKVIDKDEREIRKRSSGMITSRYLNISIEK